MRIGSAELEALAIGAAILGAGGGGDPLIGKLMAEQAIATYGPVTLIAAEEVADDAQVLPVAMMGAPTVSIEKIPGGDEGYTAVRRMEQHLGRPATALCPIECGGTNSMVPFVVAARTGLPVVDADGMGRAFPELQMETFHVLGLAGTPACLVDEWGNVVILETVDNFWMEDFARACTVRMGGSAHLVDYPMSGRDLKRTAVRGTISLGMAIGRAVQHAQREHLDPVQAIVAATDNGIYGRGLVLFQGKIVDVARRTTRGFAVGTMTLRGSGDFREQEMEVAFQNENLVARLGGRTVATVPDIIIAIDPEAGQAVTTEKLRYGQRVSIVGIPTPPIMRSPAALAVWGPRAFGYAEEFIPVEVRAARDRAAGS